MRLQRLSCCGRRTMRVSAALNHAAAEGGPTPAQRPHQALPSPTSSAAALAARRSSSSTVTIARESTSTSVAAAALKSYWLRRISTATQKAHGSLLRARLPRPQAPAMRGMRASAAPLAHIIDFPNQATIAGRGPRSAAA